ncbi:MAG: HpaII family restriction endonuclease [Phascolarctobacterium sp.]|nr:HpaII family restriction endonuclease [Phascolarctobacterium sp.]
MNTYVEELMATSKIDENVEFIIDKSQRIEFIFNIDGINDEIMIEFNHEYKRDKCKFLKLYRDNIIFKGITNKIFNQNLIMIDSKMPEMVSWLYLYSFIQEIYRSSDLMRVLEEYNPLKYHNINIYEYKYKKLLANIVLGMLPNENWEGDNYFGSCIVAHIGKKILVCDGKNREGFEEFLLNNTSLGDIESDVYDCTKIYKEDGQYYMNLNLQIRFDA